MGANGWLQFALYLAVLLLLVKPLGGYMARVFDGTSGLVRRCSVAERALYRLCAIDPDEPMDWRRYTLAFLVFNLLGGLAVYALQRLQGPLPLNPQHMGAVSPDSSFNTAVSFVSNTNWQGYGGESTMSDLTQMLALAVQNFLSAASGIAVVLALIRGFRERQSRNLGNFTLAQSVSEQAERVSERITTLLDLVRLETGAVRPRLDWYGLDELVGSVLHRLESRLRQHPVLVELPTALPLLHVDGRLIEQVLENLLDNAVKYTPARARIRISARTGRRQLEISVEDEGPGLPGNDPQILFEKFQRGAPEGAVGGIGLGLTICRTILSLHGGRVWAENRAPHGAAFRFTLPLPEHQPLPDVPADALTIP